MKDKETATQCDLNPVFNGVYEWGDPAKTKVAVFTDGSAEITQGDQVVKVDSLGFFGDVSNVFYFAITGMPEGDLKEMLTLRSLGTSRSWPSGDWD